MRGLMGECMAAPWTCLEYLPWKRKYVLLGKTPVVVCTSWSFYGNSGSCHNFCLTMLREGCMETSKEGLDVIAILRIAGNSP